MFKINKIIMNIDRNPGISFQARLINFSKVKRFSTLDNSYVQARAAFVEIDPNNMDDVKAIYNVAKYWEDEHFASNISHTVQQLCMGTLSAAKHKVFAITKQKNKLDKLDDRKILGIVELKKKNNSVDIQYLQVNPEFIYSCEPEYKYVGSKIIDCIKNYYKTLIKVRSEYSVTKFYEKNGFDMVNGNKFEYEWKPE